MTIAFYDTKEYDRPAFEYFCTQRNISVKFIDSHLNDITVKLAEGCEAICIFVNDVVTKHIVDELFNMGIKAIFLRCAGFNNVDLNACYGKIHVFRVPAYSPYAVAEHAFALLLTSVRRIHKAYNRTKEYNFSLNGLTGFDLHGKTVGVIGAGKIGRVFIDIAKGFGMNVLAYDLYASPIEGVQFVTLDELFEKSDIISLHCPLTSENQFLINKDTINKMKHGVIIINTSRGGLINSKDLLEGIKKRRVSGAVLDVYDEEGDIFYEDKSNHIMNNDILLQLIAMPNVIITSHQAFLTKEALENIADTTTKNIVDFFASDYSENEVCYHCPNIQNCKKKRKARCF